MKIDLRQILTDSWEIIRESRSVKIFGGFAISAYFLEPRVAQNNLGLVCIIAMLLPITIYLLPIGNIGMILVAKKKVRQEIETFSDTRTLSPPLRPE